MFTILILLETSLHGRLNFVLCFLNNVSALPKIIGSSTKFRGLKYQVKIVRLFLS